jgi:hypothetical protein
MEVTGFVGYVLVGDVNNDIIFTLLKVVSIFDRRNYSAVAAGMAWYQWKGHYYSFMKTKMMMRRN